MKVARQEEKYYLARRDIEDIDYFPCEDLRTIDQLWVIYSNGKFGFSVQKQIYQSLGSRKKYDKKVWEAFGNRVGWSQGGSWLSYSDIFQGSLDTHPEGHLPVILMNRSSLSLYQMLASYTLMGRLVGWGGWPVIGRAVCVMGRLIWDVFIFCLLLAVGLFFALFALFVLIGISIVQEFIQGETLRQELDNLSSTKVERSRPGNC